MRVVLLMADFLGNPMHHTPTPYKSPLFVDYLCGQGGVGGLRALTFLALYGAHLSLLEKRYPLGIPHAFLWR